MSVESVSVSPARSLISCVLTDPRIDAVNYGRALHFRQEAPSSRCSKNPEKRRRLSFLRSWKEENTQGGKMRGYISQDFQPRVLLLY